MWQDALRVCKEYVPHKLQALQDEYDRETMANSTRYKHYWSQEMLYAVLLY